MKIISKIREKGCRSCFQNIHTKLNQGGKEINMEDLKVFMGNMIDTGLLIDKGRTEKESFYLNNAEKKIMNKSNLKMTNHKILIISHR